MSKETYTYEKRPHNAHVTKRAYKYEKRAINRMKFLKYAQK